MVFSFTNFETKHYKNDLLTTSNIHAKERQLVLDRKIDFEKRIPNVTAQSLPNVKPLPVFAKQTPRVEHKNPGG